MKKDLRYMLLVAFNRSNKVITRQILEKGLMPGQPKILEFLLENDGCTQKEIGKGCVLDKSTVTSLLSRMEENGLVSRESQKGDRRIVRIFLTPLGREKAEIVREIGSRLDESAWKGIPEDERRRFTGIFEKVIRNLEELEE